MGRDIRTVNNVAGQQIEYDEIIKHVLSNDPTPTYDEADSGNYTDLQLAAWVTLAPAAPVAIATAGANPETLQGIMADIERQPTTRQLVTAREIVKRRHSFTNAVSGRRFLKSIPTVSRERVQ